MTNTHSDKIKEILKDFRFTQPPFVEGETYINVAPSTPGLLSNQEVMEVIDVMLSGHITEGEKVRKFEREMARYLGVRYASMCNSGSSANLLALSALTSPILGSRALLPGDEIITTAVGFPTTVNPIIQIGCVPVFIDVNLTTHNTSEWWIANAITEKTKAIILAHTLGNIWNVEAVKRLAEDNQLWLIEDGCDALGGTWDGKMVGSFGDLSTLSMYPAHHMAVGEGGMVFTDNAMLNKIVRSFRDWGRECWCQPGHDNTCGKRFSQTDKGDLPDGFDHKYVYSHIGYNLKSTDLQAAIGLAQFRKLPEFVQDRKENWAYLRDELDLLREYFVLPEPLPKAEPSWFGFVLSVRETAPFTRNQLTTYLEEHKIGTRNVFAGNLTRQPAYKGKNWRMADPLGALVNSDRVMDNSFWIGVHPQLTKRMLDYMVQTIKDFVNENRHHL